MIELKNQIKELSEKYFPDVLSFRRHLHENPELSFEEFETAAFIEKTLASFGIDHANRIAKTGVTFTLNGASAGRTIALRASMSALK
ncbi:MAG: amidohydrolase, partial [Bacteroidota bacterium]